MVAFLIYLSTIFTETKTYTISDIEIFNCHLNLMMLRKSVDFFGDYVIHRMKMSFCLDLKYKITTSYIIFEDLFCGAFQFLQINKFIQRIDNMRRIKMNLDMLENVRKQFEIAMNSTEKVINEARADLNSMTEEVWEGEDGDMARELLGDLVYKEMPETWRHIDSCHTAIKSAQKKAYEAKNFANGFSLVFRDGAMPSATDFSICGGDVMCNKESCEKLKNSMEAAAQKAQSIYDNISSVSDILSQLETNEAKFDYASYIEPIKDQAQNVVDRARLFCKAVSIYKDKVENLDREFSKDLIAALPESSSTPFDPSCLGLGEVVHMNNGDITDTLEDYSIEDVLEELSPAQIETILSILFDNKNNDLSDMSEHELKVALLKVPEDKFNAVLVEMNLSIGRKGAISSICAGIKGKTNKRLQEMYDTLKREYGFTDAEMEYLKRYYPQLLKTLYDARNHSSSLENRTYDKIKKVLDTFHKQHRIENGDILTFPETGEIVTYNDGLNNYSLPVSGEDTWSIEFNYVTALSESRIVASRMETLMSRYTNNNGDIDLLKFDVNGFGECYAGAMVEGFGEVGDIVKVTLSDGTSFNFIILDVKNTHHKHDELAKGQVQNDEYGHAYLRNNETTISINPCEFMVAGWKRDEEDNIYYSAVEYTTELNLDGNRATEAQIIGHIDLE